MDYNKGSGLEYAILIKATRGSVLEFAQSKVNDSFFTIPECKDQYAFIKNHVANYKCMPSSQLLLSKGGGYADLVIMDIPIEPIKYYVDQLVKLQKFKTLNWSLKESADAIKEKELDKIVDIFNKALKKCHEYTNWEHPARTSNDLLPVYAQHLQDSISNKGIYAGWPTLDKTGTLVNPGQLACIVGRTGFGKSMLMQYIALHVSQVQQKKTLFVSCEMDDKQMIFRDGAIRLS